MLSSVLKSDRAIAVNIEIMRSFVRIRRSLEVDKSLARKFDRIERKLASHDQALVGQFQTIIPPTEAASAMPSSLNEIYLCRLAFQDNRCAERH
jgi:nitric oxide synthase oxygenase domain/subunit